MADMRFTAEGSERTQRQAQFALVPDVERPRSVLSRSHSLKTTFNAGYLVPIFLDEILPGDSMSLEYNNFIRMVTPLKAPMDNIYCDVHFWFVSNRLVHRNWTKLMGEQDDPSEDVTTYLVPILGNDGAPAITGNQWLGQTLGDYFGLPTYVPRPHPTINALPFRCFHLIYNEWYRDQNLQDKLPIGGDGVDKATEYGDGPDNPDIYFQYAPNETLPRRGKRHDFYTAQLPFPQKGPDVLLPLGGTAPIVATGDGIPEFNFPNSSDPTVTAALEADGAGSSFNLSMRRLVGSTGPGDNELAAWFDTKLVTDLENGSTTATINALRVAFAIQRLYERDARGGTRYIELLKSHFGVISPDARLQRPEYLGGSTQMLNVNPVTQTAFGSDSTPNDPNERVGDLASFVTGSHSSRGFSKSFVEHGWVIGVCSVRAELTWQRNLERHWVRRQKTDYAWPALSHLGEQATLNHEVWCSGLDGDGLDEEVFGYIPRFDEYRYKPSRVTGAFSSQNPQSLDVWHLGLDFTSRPTLNDTFIEDRPPIARIIPVTNQPHFKADWWFRYRCARVLPTHGTPGYLDHF